eukprot:3939878-Rhodomonas_salina.1
MAVRGRPLTRIPWTGWLGGQVFQCTPRAPAPPVPADECEARRASLKRDLMGAGAGSFRGFRAGKA